MLTCVRPLLRRVPCRRPRLKCGDQVQVRPTRLKRLSQSWFSRSRLSDPCAIPPAVWPSRAFFTRADALRAFLGTDATPEVRAILDELPETVSGGAVTHAARIETAARRS